MSEATTDSLICASSSSFSARCFSAVRAPTRSIRYRVRSRSRRICGGGTKLAQHLPLGDLGQPDRVQPAGLGTAGQMLDVTGVDQPGLESGRLQQIEDRLPIVAGGLHHDPGHAQDAQVIGHLQQRAGHRRIRLHLLQATPWPVLVRHPRAADQEGLPDVQRRDPLDDLLVVLGFLQHAASPAAVAYEHPAQAARKSRKDEANLIRVLKAQ